MYENRPTSTSNTAELTLDCRVPELADELLLEPSGRDNPLTGADAVTEADAVTNGVQTEDEWPPRSFANWLLVTEDLSDDDKALLTEYHNQIARHLSPELTAHEFDDIVESFDANRLPLDHVALINQNRYAEHLREKEQVAAGRIACFTQRNLDPFTISSIGHLKRSVWAHPMQGEEHPDRRIQQIRAVKSGIPITHCYPLMSSKPLCGGPEIDLAKELVPEEIHSAPEGACSICSSILHYSSSKKAANYAGSIIKELKGSFTSPYRDSAFKSFRDSPEIYRSVTPMESLYTREEFHRMVGRNKIVNIRVTRVLVEGPTVYIFVDRGHSFRWDVLALLAHAKQMARIPTEELKWVEMVAPIKDVDAYTHWASGNTPFEVLSNGYDEGPHGLRSQSASLPTALRAHS